MSAVALGRCFPVATCEAGDYGAVLYVCRHRRGKFHLPGHEYENEIEYLMRDGATWRSIGSGGCGRVNALDPPRALLDKYVMFGTGTYGFGDDDEMMSFTGGLCSAAVAAIETSDLDGR